ncbi:MAG: type II toxin-antitoxin system RelE/ParE family toxin [Alphaproteobacteria bacterium]|nr:type II toxin-antitoxin system RelE/ParE family toxin [Alphaproteobacteria bacterium]
MRVAYSRRAVRQITETFDYIAEDNPAAANTFLVRVEEMASLLALRPGIGRRTQKAGVQVIGLRPYRYLLFYKVLNRGDELRIIRLRHMSRRDAANVRDL